MYDPTKKSSLRKLRQAVWKSRQELRHFRAMRVHYIREFVGNNYGPNGAERPVYLNYMELATSIYTILLAANNPKVLCTTFNTMLKPQAAELEIVLNTVVKELGFSDTMRRIVKDAMFTMGIAKVAEDWSDGSPKRYFDRVSFDDWVHDCRAREFKEAEYMGNRYRIDYESFIDFYGEDWREKVTPTTRFVYDEDGQEKAEEISKDTIVDPLEYSDQVELIDLWFPETRQVLTLPYDCNWEEPLSVMDWDGPDAGPYHFLYFSDVPDQVMPLAPAAVWLDLHDLSNKLMRKQADQAERQKTIGMVKTGNDSLGNKIVNANDGDVISVQDPRDYNESSLGGPDPRNQAMSLRLEQAFNLFAGNPFTIGGLTQSADTATQEQLIATSSGNRVGDMQNRVQEFAVGVISALAEFEWEDNETIRDLTRRAPGGLDVPFRFSSQTRVGEFPDYEIMIEPYSMRYKSPQERRQEMTMVIERILMPLMPILQQQGITFNAKAFLEKYAEYANMPELQDILSYATPPASMDAGTPSSPASSPNTTNTNIRVNKPGGATMEGANKVLQSVLMGAGAQDDELAGLMRGVS